MSDLADMLLQSEIFAHDVPRESKDLAIPKREVGPEKVYMEPLMDSVASAILGKDYEEGYTYKMMTEKDITTVAKVDSSGKIVEDYKLETNSEEIMSYNEMWDRVSSISYERLDAVKSDVMQEIVKDHSQWPMYLVLTMFLAGLGIISLCMFLFM